MFGARCLIALGALLLPVAPAAGVDDCRLKFEGECQPEPEGVLPLKLEITSGLKFSRLALSRDGQGSVSIEPGTGAKSTTGNVQDLGGRMFQGEARVTGEPMRIVRIAMPTKVTLRGPDGTVAELSDLQTDLPAFPVLDSTGAIEFKFGGTLHVTGMGHGRLRGRIPIEVEYAN